MYQHYISWPTVVESDLKVPFSVATASRCRGGGNSFSLIAPLTLDPKLMILIVKLVPFLSLCFDSTCDSILVSWTIIEHSSHYAEMLFKNEFIDVY